MVKWIAVEKARAELRHGVVCPNVTGKTNERIGQSKRLVLVRSPYLTSHKGRENGTLWAFGLQMSCRLFPGAPQLLAPTSSA